MVIEVDLEIEDVTVEEAVERFTPDGAWYSRDIWCENYSVESWTEIKIEE